MGKRVGIYRSNTVDCGIPSRATQLWDPTRKRTRLAKTRILDIDCQPMKRNASAVWHGNLKSGKGTLSSDSGVLKDTAYSFAARFADGTGTNPEELIAAAHAGCFTMALSAALEGAGFVADTLNTTAALTLENDPKTSCTVPAIHLTTAAKSAGTSSPINSQRSRRVRRLIAPHFSASKDEHHVGCKVDLKRGFQSPECLGNWRSSPTLQPTRHREGPSPTAYARSTTTL